MRWSGLVLSPKAIMSAEPDRAAMLDLLGEIKDQPSMPLASRPGDASANARRMRSERPRSERSGDSRIKRSRQRSWRNIRIRPNPGDRRLASCF